MIRVLIIVNRFNIGGHVSNAGLIAKHLPKDKYTTKLIGGNIDNGEDDYFYWLKSENISYDVIDEMKRPINFKEDRKAYEKLVEIINEFKPDIIHTHASKAGLLGRLAAFKCNTPVVVHTFHGHIFHSYFGKIKTFIFKSIEQYLASKSSKIIAISPEQKRELSIDHKIAPESKFEIIPLGFDLNRFQENIERKRIQFREKYQLQTNDIAIGIIGRLAPIKNHHFFINVAKNVLNHNNTKHVKFFIIGDGETKNEIMQHCSHLNIKYNKHDDKNFDSNVIFTSWIKEVDFALAGLDIVVLTSKNEGTPVSLIEAQAANKPIVTTNVGGIKDIIINNETGYLCEQNNIENFTNKLLELIYNESLREKMSQNSWDNVKEKFHYTRLINDIDKLYTSLLKK